MSNVEDRVKDIIVEELGVEREKLTTEASFSRSTPSSSTMMSLTLSSTLLMASSEGGWCNSDRHTAVNCQDLPGNVPGEIGCEKEHRSRNVLRASGPAKGDAA